MSLPDTIFIFMLALIIFGPKKLPEIGRQLGKLVGEFRRASNEFKFQIEEELRQADLSDRRKTTPTIAPPPAETAPSAALDQSLVATLADRDDPETVLPAGQHPNPEYLTAQNSSPEPTPAAVDPVAAADGPTLTVASAAGTQPRTGNPFAPSAAPPASAPPAATGDTTTAEIAHG
jgi:sec-independent protein translocase protein TatB